MNHSHMIRPLIGRILISLIAIETGAGAFFFDFNRSHVFNPFWLPHARFHAAMGVFMGAGLALLALWYCWRRAGDERTNLQVAAWMAALYFLSFYPAALVPGAGLSEPGNEVPLVLGLVAPQLIEGTISVLLCALGYWLARPRRAGAT